MTANIANNKKNNAITLKSLPIASETHESLLNCFYFLYDCKLKNNNKKNKTNK